MSDTDEQISESGGTMRRLSGPARAADPDLAVLEPYRREPGGLVPAGEAPSWQAGEVLRWHYGASVDLLRVVRDDERGLVAWLPSGSERLMAVPRDGLGPRDRTMAERIRVWRDRDFDLAVRPWNGPGILRVAPTGVPWSVWYFTEDDGSFAGYYVNLEMPHRRPPDGSAHLHTRDLTLDLWLEPDGELWLKDHDELAAGVEGGIYTPEQARAIHDIAERARADLVEPRAWPLDEGWETWRPPPAWDEPLTGPTP